MIKFFPIFFLIGIAHAAFVDILISRADEKQKCNSFYSHVTPMHLRTLFDKTMLKNTEKVVEKILLKPKDEQSSCKRELENVKEEILERGNDDNTCTFKLTEEGKEQLHNICTVKKNVMEAFEHGVEVMKSMRNIQWLNAEGFNYIYNFGIKNNVAKYTEWKETCEKFKTSTSVTSEELNSIFDISPETVFTSTDIDVLFKEAMELLSQTDNSINGFQGTVEIFAVGTVLGKKIRSISPSFTNRKHCRKQYSDAENKDDLPPYEGVSVEYETLVLGLKLGKAIYDQIEPKKENNKKLKKTLYYGALIPILTYKPIKKSFNLPLSVRFDAVSTLKGFKEAFNCTKRRGEDKCMEVVDKKSK